MLDVIFEDNHLLVVNKPAGLLTQKDNTANESLEEIAKEWLKEKYQKPGAVFLEPIHRLDKPVSGIVCFAKTSKALSRLNQSIREDKTEKIYHAYVEGHLEKKSGELKHYLIHDEFKARIVLKPQEGAKAVLLEYKVLEQKKEHSLIEIKLHTGRYHQIRAQFSFIGHPILGDKKYGSTLSLSQNIILLHHYQFSIPHPITNELKTFMQKESF